MKHKLTLILLWVAFLPEMWMFQTSAPKRPKALWGRLPECMRLRLDGKFFIQALFNLMTQLFNKKR